MRSVITIRIIIGVKNVAGDVRKDTLIRVHIGVDVDRCRVERNDSVAETSQKIPRQARDDKGGAQGDN